MKIYKPQHYVTSIEAPCAGTSMVSGVMVGSFQITPSVTVSWKRQPKTYGISFCWLGLLIQFYWRARR